MGLTPEPTSPYKTYIDDSSVIAARFPKPIVIMIDDARDKATRSGIELSRSAWVKTAIHWYLNYLGYKPPRPTVGGRRSTKN